MHYCALPSLLAALPACLPNMQRQRYTASSSVCRAHPSKYLEDGSSGTHGMLAQNNSSRRTRTRWATTLVASNNRRQRHLPPSLPPPPRIRPPHTYLPPYRQFRCKLSVITPRATITLSSWYGGYRIYAWRRFTAWTTTAHASHLLYIYASRYAIKRWTLIYAPFELHNACARWRTRLAYAHQSCHPTHIILPMACQRGMRLRCSRVAQRLDVPAVCCNRAFADFILSSARTWRLESLNNGLAWDAIITLTYKNGSRRHSLRTVVMPVLHILRFWLRCLNGYSRTPLLNRRALKTLPNIMFVNILPGTRFNRFCISAN